eukprot:3754970-Alexandrium_andersonii.AAC.1
MALYGVEVAALPAEVSRSLAAGAADAIVGAHAPPRTQALVWCSPSLGCRYWPLEVAWRRS